MSHKSRGPMKMQEKQVNGAKQPMGGWESVSREGYWWWHGLEGEGIMASSFGE